MRLDEVTGDPAFDKMMGGITSGVKPPEPKKKASEKVLAGSIDYIRQCLTNASISVPPYNSPDFRIQQIDNAINRLEHIRKLMYADKAIGDASNTD